MGGLDFLFRQHNLGTYRYNLLHNEKLRIYKCEFSSIFWPIMMLFRKVPYFWRRKAFQNRSRRPCTYFSLILITIYTNLYFTIFFQYKRLSLLLWRRVHGFPLRNRFRRMLVRSLYERCYVFWSSCRLQLFLFAWIQW